jgi:O-antigen polymerase
MTGLISYLNPRFLFKAVFACYFLLAMHYYSPNMGGYGLYMPYNVVGWMLIATLIGLGFWQVSRTGIVELSKTQILGWIGFLFFLLPLVYPNNEFAHRAMYRILFLMGGLAFYSALVQFRFGKAERLLLLYILLAAVVMQSLLGLVQYYGFFSEYYFILNKKELPYGSFQQKNVMTIFMATGIGISLFLMGKDSNLSASNLKKWLVFLIPFTGSIIIMAIKAKAGYIGLFVVLLLMLPSVSIKEKFYQRWFTILFTGILIGWFSPSIYDSFQHQKIPDSVLDSGNKPPAKEPDLQAGLYTRNLDSQIATVHTRKTTYETTFRMWKDNPFTGVGYGRFPSLYREYVASRRANEAGFDYIMDEYFDHPHNETLLWLSEGGIVPFLGLLIFAGAYLILIIKRNLKEALAYLALVAPILLHTQFEFPFDTSLAHWIVFLTLFHVPDDSDEIRYQYGLHRVMIIPAVVIPVMAAFYLGTVLNNISILTRFEKTGMKNYSLLLQIKDPGPLHLKYDNYVLKATMEVGLKTKNEQSLQLFLDKAEQFVQHTPLLHVYKGMVRSLLVLGREKEAIAMVERARYLYPDTKEAWLQPGNQK